MPQPTLLDVAKKQNADKQIGVIDEAFRSTPEIALLPVKTIKGRDFKTLIRTGLPTVGFRSANEGVTPDKSRWENRQVSCSPITPRWECDTAVAAAYEGTTEEFCLLQGDGTLRATFIALAKQMYYGTGNGGDAKGFPGLIQQVDAALTVDAQGTTDDTASSVWALRFGLKDIQLVVGGDGKMVMSKPSSVRLKDNDGNVYYGYSQELSAWLGLQVGSIHSVGRIKNLTTDSGKGLTDDLVAELLEKFPDGYEPHALLMTRRSRRQLQKSRVAAGYAPTPTESQGIPIYTTPALLNTESLAL